MKLWLIRRQDKAGFDEAAGFVVCAESEAAAREAIRQADAVAAAQPDDGRLPMPFGPGLEGPGVWDDRARCPALELGLAKPGLKAGVILRDYNS